MRRTTGVVAVGCGMLSAPLFVGPSPARAPVVRLSVEASAGARVATGSATSGLLSGSVQLLSIGAVAAVVVSRVRPRSQHTARQFSPQSQLGVQAPVQFWDPLGFCNDGNEANFKRRRAVEVKHGRVSMLAVIGYIAPEYFRFPGELSPSEGIRFEDVPNGLAALSKVPAVGWGQIFLFAGFIEGGGLSRFGFTPNPNDPTDLGLGFLGAPFLSKIKDPKVRAQKLNAEIANGRLAMFAIIAFFFQNGVTGSAGPEMYGFGENSAVILTKIFFPALAAFGIMGETFRRGPDDKFMKNFTRSDYFGKDKRV